MADYVKFAETVAREAGTLLREKLYGTHRIMHKGAINIVTEADLLSERLIIDRIEKSFPGHDILTEEAGAIDRGSSFRWIIDPLDGTTNYAHGYPVFCVSVALEMEGVIKIGAIYNPALNEMFTAEINRGAFLNGQSIKVSSTAELSGSLLATGFPYDIRDSSDNNINYFAEMARCAQAIRRAGSAALDLAYTAAGRFDGFWELKLKPWDTAAGCLMVKEAGGRVTDISGGSHSLNSTHILASNGRIHRAMLDVIRRASDSPATH